MPIYVSRCPKCGRTVDEYRSVANWNRQPTCQCGTLMQQDLVAQSQQTAVRGNYKKPIVSDAMSFLAHPDDVTEHRQRFPNIDLDFDNGVARPVFRSLGQKRKYLKAMNWADVKDFAT